jgi:nitrogen regulatory protein PII
MRDRSEPYDLIVTIVPKGEAETILQASRDAGAEGGTVMYGRGIGVHETRRILGISIEPEKEILLTVIPHRLTEVVMDAIVQAGRLATPGAGIIFSLSLDRVAGICHLDPEPPTAS